MRGETNTDNELESEDQGATAAGGRRPSVDALQNILKRVSKSPFQNQYQNLVSSSSDSGGSSVNESQSKQFMSQTGELLTDAAASGVTDSHQPHRGQNGVNRDLARINPFYTNNLESCGEGAAMEDVGRRSSEDVKRDTIFVPWPDFQSSPLDRQPEMATVEKGAEFSELPKDSFETFTLNRMQDLLQAPPLATKKPPSDSPDLFGPIPAQPQNLSRTFPLESADLLQEEGVNLFQATKEEVAVGTRKLDLFDKSMIFVDSFKSPLNKEDELFKSSEQKAANPFYTAPPRDANVSPAIPGGEMSSISEDKRDPFMKEDIFGMFSFKDTFSSSSTNTVDPFPSPLSRDLFQDVSSLDDPFGTTPSSHFVPFQDLSPETPDIFKPLPLKPNGRDVFGMIPSNTVPKPTYSTPLGNSPFEMKPDTLSALEFLEDSQSTPAIEAKFADRPHNILLTTPQGTEHDILKRSPFTRARNRPVVRSQSSAEMTHVQTMKRPPKPLPRSGLPRTENPIEPDSTAPKVPPKPSFRPALRSISPPKPRTPDTKLMDSEDPYESILLTGQERCVEDWPDDSPQLNPDFKPAGSLRLRRDSFKLEAVSEGGSGDDQEGSVKKKDKKFRMSLLSRKGSKEKFPNDSKEGKSKSLPTSRKSSKEYLSEEHEEREQNEMVSKNKFLKTRGSKLRSASFTSSVLMGKHGNGPLPQESQQEHDIYKKNSIHQWSEGKVLDASPGEEEEEEEEMASYGTKKKKKLKIRFVPKRGFSIVVEKGASGYKDSKDKSQEEEVLGAHGYTPRKKSQDDVFEDARESPHCLPSTSKAAFLEDEHFQEAHYMSGPNGDDDPYEMEDCKPVRFPPINQPRLQSSKEDLLDYTNPHTQKSSFSADDLYDEDLIEDCKQKASKHKGPVPLPRHPKTGKGQSRPPQASANHFAGDNFYETFTYDDEDKICKPNRESKVKGFMKPMSKNKARAPEWEDPPGAASSDFLSEAAAAEWHAAQMDEYTLEGLEEECEDGDTDSLMEWWNTVEQWDEVPSDDENVLKEDESRSFTILADKVHRGLRVFNKVFTERAEVLWQFVITLHAIADNINEFHQKARIAGITGGTTTAVGGVAAIAGLAMAPFTFGTSLLVTAVGVGVATAGGIASASAAISDNVHNLHDRKKVEIVLQEYEAHLKTIAKILHFVNTGMYKLRGHPFLRSGTRHYSKDWETRRAVQMISLVDSPVMKGTQLTDASLASIQGLFKGMDKYFLKDSKELKKGHKKEVVMQIKEVANALNDGIVQLNAIREELQEATGNTCMNLFRREKAAPAVPPRPSKEDLDNPVEHSRDQVTAAAEVTRVLDPKPKRTGVMGVMDKVNPFKSTSQTPVGSAAASESPEQGVASSKTSPGGLMGVMQKVNPFKSSSQDGNLNEPLFFTEAPSQVSRAASSESLEHGAAAATQNRGMFKGMMQKVNPFRSYTQTSEEECQTDSAAPSPASSSLPQEDSSSSDSADDSAIERHTVWYDGPPTRAPTFRIRRILPTNLFGSRAKDSSSDTGAAAQEVVEVETLQMAEEMDLDPLDDDEGLVGWWRTVDGWDDWNEGKQSDEPEELVEQAADRVFMAARLFVRFFNRRGASLQQRILELMSVADAADAFHKKTVKASVGGGVASVAGSVTTITGLILAPFTAGASLIVTAVGIGVATAGGVASASANITDTVHSKTDRKKVEKIIQDYEGQMKDIRECLEFLQEGMELLEEWNFEEYAENISKKHLNQNVKHVMKEGGRAGKALVINTESLINTVQVLSAAGGAAKAAQVMSVTTGVMSGLFLALDLFFLAKDAKELKDGAKTEFAAKIREVCQELQDGLLELNRIKEQLQRTIDGIEVVVEEEEDVEILKSDLKKLVEFE
ncbi:uncharacterized protein LOC119221790 [Pungitius pungitius]|uniref:uncharacterized protein LOC119221790 n=1 Tax=Pungitius pungitius TaxID=134920 RepID=UPI002E1623E8